MFYVYALQDVADDSSFYLGCTRDLRQRLRSHNEGYNKSTCNRQWKLVYYEAFLTLSGARKRETHLKYDGRAKRFLMQRIRDSLE